MEQQNSQNEIGYLSFRSKMSPKLSSRLTKTIDKSDWVLDVGKYMTENCKQIFSSTTEARFERMWLCYNDEPDIPMHISHIAFPYMVEIWLSKNNISTIEILSTIFMPNLEELWLRDNNITSVRPLRKASLKQFKVLSLHTNKIVEMDCLAEMLTKNMKELWVEYENQEDVQGQSLDYCFKMQPMLNYLWVSSDSRTISKPIVKAVKKRHHKITIVTQFD